MDNELFLQNAKNTYETLNYFTIKNNMLILNYNGTYMVPIKYTDLSKLNTNIFLLNPHEIINLIYMLELLHNNTLTEQEKTFINGYVKNYLKINDDVLNGNDKLQMTSYLLSIPIYTAYDPSFINTEPSILIQNIINEHSESLNSGKSKYPKLVLKNDNFIPIEDENDLLNEFGKAGFTTIILISTAIIATCLYIAFFIVNK